MPLNLKKMPGVKQLRGVKDKAVLKLYKEIDDSRKEKDALAKQLQKTHQTAQQLIDDMAALIREFGDAATIEEQEEALRGSQDYLKHVATIASTGKKIQDYQKKVSRLDKVENALMKIASKDAAVKAMMSA